MLSDPLKERTLIVGTNEAYAPPAMEKELANSLLAAPELFKSILHNQLIAGALRVAFERFCVLCRVRCVHCNTSARGLLPVVCL